MAQKNENGEAGNQITPQQSLSQSDQQALNKLKNYLQADEAIIEERLEELNNEWDIERCLQMNAAVMAITGTALGIFSHRRWFALPVLFSVFLAQQAIQGWSLPVPILRKLGFRTRKEIEREKYGLKVIRGDFKYLRQNIHKVWQAINQ